MADLTAPLAAAEEQLKQAKRARKEAGDQVDALQAQVDATKAHRDELTVDIVNWQAAVDVLTAAMPPVTP